MRLKQPFCQLPKSFCASTLAEEVRALPDSAWEPHPLGHTGNDAVPLITPGGKLTTGFTGPMGPTEHLLKCPYVMELMSEIGAVWGRSRFMRLAPGAIVPSHVDIHYYWRTHWRIHIPVITSDRVIFTCGDASVHMKAGESWLFDSFRMHGVHNGGSEKRVHLVLDTVGGEYFSELIDLAQHPAEASHVRPIFPPGQGRGNPLAFELINAPKIMSPWEMRCHLTFLFEETEAGPTYDAVCKRLCRFVDAWSAAWAQFGDADEGIPTFQRLVAAAHDDVYAAGADDLKLSNKLSLFLALREIVFRMAAPIRNR